MSDTTLNPEIAKHFETHRLHPDLELCRDGTINIRDYSRRSDENQTKTLQIHDFYLPANFVYENISNLNDCPYMCIPAIEALSHAASLTPLSKTKCNRLIDIFRTIAKYIEHLWLNDRYRLSQVMKEDCEELARTLAESGWHEALDIENRLLDAFTAPGLPTPNKNNKSNLTNKMLSKLIGTNLGHVEFSKYFEFHYQSPSAGQEVSDTKLEKRTEAPIRPLRFSNLRNTMDAINYLHYASEEYRIPYLPYLGSTLIASKLTEAPGRTADIDGAQAGLMLESALTMIYQTAPILLKIIKHAAAVFEERTYTHSTRRQFFEELSNRISKIPSNELKGAIYTLNEVSTIKSLNTMIKDILTACFISIATFNARRKDEVIHKKFGLHKDCCQLANRELNIYEAEFYIEKSTKDYVLFFIGDATTQSIKILEELQVILGNSSANSPSSPNPRENTLFRFALFKSNGLSRKLSQYNFQNYKNGHSFNFIQNLVDNCATLKITPHMFRRLYCTIFMSQHEYPHLPALSQQLRHGELAVTQIYITSPTTQNAAANLSKLYDWKIDQYAAAHVTHKLDLAQAMTEAKSEKFGEIIYSILSHEKTSGSYSKFIRNAYKSLQRSLQLQSLENIELVDTLIKQLQIRGYSPEPFRHSQCMVGASKLKTKSKCWDSDSQSLQKEKSAPELCSHCPFSFTSIAHISNMKADAVTLLTQIKATSPHSLASTLLQHQHDNLCKVISYHESKLERNHA